MSNKIFSFFLILNNILIFAHSGRTDSKGGHYDTKTGEYHFHHHNSSYGGFLIVLFIGICAVIFLFLISRSTKTDSPQKAFQNYELSKQEKEVEKWKRNQDRREDNRGFIGCFVYIIAFAITMISIFAIPDGNGLFVVFLFILFISIYDPKKKR